MDRPESFSLHLESIMVIEHCIMKLWISITEEHNLTSRTLKIRDRLNQLTCQPQLLLGDRLAA